MSRNSSTSSTETWQKSSDSNFGDSLRRREKRTQQYEEDRVLIGNMRRVHISSSSNSLTSVRPGSAGDPPLILDCTTSAPADLPSQPEHETINDEPPANTMKRLSSSHKDAVKVLCSYGGSFVTSSSDSHDKCYRGGGTRLLTLELTCDTTYEELMAQLRAAKLDGVDDEGFHIYYELPDEHGIYVVLTNDEDVRNMYDEWKAARDSGGNKKLRLFAEVPASDPLIGSPQPPSNIDNITSALAQAAVASSAEAPKLAMAIQAAHAVLSTESVGSVPIPLPLSGAASEPVKVLVSQSGDMHHLKDTLKDRMEVIPKSDISLSKLLGAGGYGEVYLGKWRGGTDVAVKCLSPALWAPDGEVGSTDPKHVLELMEEAQLLFNLRHPNVVWVFGIVVESPNDDLASRFRAPAIVTEYMASGSLRAALNRSDPSMKPPWVRVVLALDAARGMEYLHSKHIVHFDLKSGNLLLGWRDRRPMCKVADFGLSKQRRQTYVSGVKSHTGTLPWMAPEILKTPNTVDEKVDVYSFGIVMWELWTGYEPHKGMVYPTLLHLRMTQDDFRPPVPGTREWDNGSLPEPELLAPGWSDLMQRCWEKDQSIRPSFQEIVNELRDMLEVVKPRKGDRKESSS